MGGECSDEEGGHQIRRGSHVAKVNMARRSKTCPEIGDGDTIDTSEGSDDETRDAVPDLGGASSRRPSANGNARRPSANGRPHGRRLSANGQQPCMERRVSSMGMATRRY